MTDYPTLFLDIDGVLNDHAQMANGYCGTKPSCVAAFNRILGEFPDAWIVISSAWRYMILGGDMSLKGFEMLLQTHGVNCHGRVVGHTGPDPWPHELPDFKVDPESWKKAGLKWRASQIRDYVEKDSYLQWYEIDAVRQWFVIDDLDLDIRAKRFYRTDGSTGLTDVDADKIIEILRAT